MKNIVIAPNVRSIPVLFRYMKRAHLRTFQQTGVFRISRLSYYHQTEKLGESIGDKHEGTSTVNFDIDHFEKTDTNKPPSAMNLLVGQMGTGAIVKNCKVINTTVSNPDYFCLCLSEARSKDLRLEFEADGVIEIKNPDKFFKEICRSLHNSIEAGFFKCEYSGRLKYYTMQNHDDDWLKYPYLKESKYSHQKEVRALWNIPNVKEDHVEVKCYSALKYCKFHYS